MMAMRPFSSAAAGRLVPLVSMLVVIFAAMAAIAVWRWVASDTQTDTADRVGAVVAVIGLVAAIGAVIVALLTIYQQQIESRRQRQMETLHLLNEQYEAIFDDILESREAGAPISEAKQRRMYNRFFTNLMTGFRYYELGLIPRRDFEEWTATLIDRFKLGACIVTGRLSPDRNDMLERWNQFDAWGHGPRSGFRSYIQSVIRAGKGIDASGAFRARIEGAESAAACSNPDVEILAKTRRDLASAASEVVRAVAVSE